MVSSKPEFTNSSSVAPLPTIALCAGVKVLPVAVSNTFKIVKKPLPKAMVFLCANFYQIKISLIII